MATKKSSTKTNAKRVQKKSQFFNPYMAIGISAALILMGVYFVVFSHAGGVPITSGSSYWGKDPYTCRQVTLQQGSKGTCVRVAQDQLQRRGFARGTATVDGIYGSGTRSSVAAFQSSRGLPADGIIGKNTWYKLLP